LEIEDIMVPRGMAIGSKFTGNEKKDLAMLQRACKKECDERIAELDNIMKSAQTISAVSKKCRDAIKELQTLKRHIPGYFTKYHDTILDWIILFRLRKSVE